MTTKDKKVKTNSVHLRLDDEDFKTLTSEAKRANVSRAELLRIFMEQGLAGYNQHNEEVIQKLKVLEDSVLQVHQLVALGALLVAELDVARKPDARIPEMSAHLKHGAPMVEGLLEGQRRGMFKN
jgi:hypothetical protein